MDLSRRAIAVAACGLLACVAALGVHVAAQPSEAVIRIVVTKFEFTPSEIRLKKGVPVVLEFVPAEVMMGFGAPDLKTRADIPPGKPVRVRFVPDRAGTFNYFCDIFCGSGHEDMNGTIVVTE
jgi:cytochrome c oxidase subunit 2